MKLSIVTINYNDAKGLQKTLRSVASQILDCRLKIEDFQLEHIIVDGESTDESVDVIKNYVERLKAKDDEAKGEEAIRREVKWVSEKDKGVYNAMNKGIKMASGEYIQILNAGDILASNEVLAKVRGKMEEVRTTDGEYPKMICGNMLKQLPNGRIIRDDNGRCEDMSFFRFFTATLNHDCVWIKRDLFNQFGLYDENLKIVSDWKWYLQVIALAGIKPVYVDIDMTIFDMTGISERNLGLRNEEREKVLREFMLAGIYEDYAARKFDIEQMNRLHRHPWAYKIVWFIERVLKKIEDKCRK